MRKNCILAAATLAVGIWPALANAQMPELSPTGTYIAVVSDMRVIDAVNEPTRAIISSVDCLLSTATPSTCVRFMSSNLPRNVQLRWTADEGHFVFQTPTSAFVYGINAGSMPPRTVQIPTPNPAYYSNVVDLPTLGQKSTLGRPDIANPAGVSLGKLLRSKNGNSFEFDKGRIQIPARFFRAGTDTEALVEIVSANDRHAFSVWSGALGKNGLLFEGGKDGRGRIDIGTALPGPLSVVWDAKTGLATGTHNSLVYKPFATTEPTGWLADYVAQVRKARPFLTIRHLTVSISGTAIATFVGELEGCNEMHLVQPARAKVLASTCSIPITRKISNEVVPLPDSSLHARYFETSQNASTGIVIYFHGGPNVTSLNAMFGADPSQGGRFNVLSVDYRGSAGHGQAYLDGLAAPGVKIMREDLEAVIKALRKKHGKIPIGFWGSSWGAIAALEYIGGGGKELAFVILESPFIDDPEQARVVPCSAISWRTIVLGVTQTGGGPCVIRSTELYEKSPGRTPIVVLVGEEDRVIDVNLVNKWSKKFEAKATCISQLISAAGGHGLVNWTSSARSKAKTSLAEWTKRALTTKPQCQATTRFP